MIQRSRLAAAILLAAFAVSNAAAQTVVGPPGTYTVQTTSATTVDYGDGWVRISWDGGPLPPIPVPPVPPGPTPTPVVEWGPIDRILTLYESTKLTGREPFYSMTVIDAFNAVAPSDPATKVPNWRIWDKDLDVTREPAWGKLIAEARSGFNADNGPMLFAADTKGRVKTISVSGLSDVELANKIKALSGSK